jgi:hypothetical protein
MPSYTDYIRDPNELNFLKNAPYLYQYLLDLMATNPEMFTTIMGDYTGGMANVPNLFQQLPINATPYEKYFNVPGFGMLNPILQGGVRTNLPGGISTPIDFKKPFIEQVNEYQADRPAIWDKDSWKGVTSGWSGIGPGNKLEESVKPKEATVENEYDYTFNKEYLRQFVNKLNEGIAGLPLYKSKEFVIPEANTPIADKTGLIIDAIFGRK